MAYEVILSTSAQVDVDAITEYISVNLDNPRAAGQLLDRIQYILELVSDSPEMFSYAKEPALAEMGCRSFNVGNYLVFYRIRTKEEVIDVVDVIYGKRDFENWKLQS